MQFSFISVPMSEALCAEHRLERGVMGLQYRSQPHKVVDLQTPPDPDSIVNVAGNGNCLFRAISVHLSGSEVNYMRLKQLTADSLAANRENFFYIPETNVDRLREVALRDRAWGEESHMIALSVALRIRIYCFNTAWNPPSWELMDGRFKPGYPQIQYRQNCGIYILNLHQHYQAVFGVAAPMPVAPVSAIAPFSASVVVPNFLSRIVSQAASLQLQSPTKNCPSEAGALLNTPIPPISPLKLSIVQPTAHSGK
jgi:hypothetical protein